MKKILAIILCIMMLPLNFTLLASAAEDAQLVRIVTDRFTGTAGQNATGWTYAQTSGNANYTYSQDPENSNESVLKLERTASGGRTKMRYDMGRLGNGKCFDKDMVITYRAYDAGEKSELQLIFRQYYKESSGDKEGHSLFTVALHKDSVKTAGKWLDVRAEIKQSGSYSITVKDGDNTVMSKNGSFAWFEATDGHTAENGFWQLDFELHSSLLGAWYIDDFCIWTYEDLSIPNITGLEEIFSDDFTGEEGGNPAGWSVNNMDNAKYVYSKDPKNEEESVLKLIRNATGSSNRVKMYKLLGESNADYIDGNMLITFRAYDEDGTGRLNLYPRAETTGAEGPQIFTVEIEKKITPDIATGVWYDCFVELKNDGVNKPTYSVWMIGDGAKISIVKDQEITNEFNGVSRLDFESNYTRQGNWYIDDLYVYRDHRDILLKAAEELSYEDIANGNRQEEVLTDLSFVNSVEFEGVTYPLQWESSDENFITPDGTVTRRSFTQNVTLTAKICSPDNTKIYVSKDFDVTVFKKDGASDADVISDYIDFYLKEELFTDEDTSEITKDLLSLPTEGVNGMTISWESDSDAIDKDGKVTRPAYDAENAEVTLTATLSLGSENGTATLNYTVLKQPDPYVDINATLELLKYPYLTSEDSEAITSDLKLPTEGVGAATISWESRHDAITNDGKVTRGDSEVTGTIIATVSNPPAAESVEFKFTVLPKLEKIFEIDMKNIKLYENALISESFDLPLAGETYGSTYVWESDNDKYLIIDGGRVTVYTPPFTEGDVKANITLTVNYKGNEKTVNYPVVIPCEGTDEEIIDAVMAQLTFEELTEEDKSSVKSNLALPTELNGVEIFWWSSNGDVVSALDENLGEVFRPVPGANPEEIVLKATFKRGYTEKTKEYEAFTVVPFENDSEVLAKAKEALIPSVVSSQKLNLITENITLPTEWKYGTTVSWSVTPYNSRDAEYLVIDGEKGIVTRPEWGCTSAKMTLTAEISYKASASVTRTYNLEILEKNYMEEYKELWREDFEAWDDAYGDEPDGGDNWSIDGGVETDQLKATIENVYYEYGDDIKEAENNKAFMVDRSVINNGAGYVYASATKAYGGVVYIGLDFKIPTGGEFKLNGRNGGQDQAPVSLVIVDEKTASLYAGKYQIEVPDGLLKPDAWNRIKLEINVAKEAYHIYLNDICVTDNLDIVDGNNNGIDTTYGVPYNYYGQGYESAIKNFRMVFQKGFKEGYYIDNAYMANTIMYTEKQLSLADAWEKEFLSKNDRNRITDTLVFPAVEAEGVRVFFYSDDSKILDTAGMIQLPSGEADVVFKVGFNDGFTEYMKSYKLHVIKTEGATELTDEEAVKADVEAAIKAISGSGMLTNLTSDLSIPTVGENGSVITAVSSDASVLANNGVITRGSTDETVTLKITATKNSATSETKELTITVAKKETTSSGTSSSPSGSSGSGIKVTYGEQTKGDTGIDIEQPDNGEEEKSIFNDLSKDHWAYSELQYMAENGIMNGTGSGNIEPERKIRREEFIKMLVTALGLKLEDGETGFTDVAENAWYAPYLAAAKKAGIVNGYADGRAGIGEEITREDMAVIIFRAAEVAQSGAADIFTDDTSISAYAKNAVYTLKDIGVINGMGDGSFAPKATASRAQTACMLYKAIKKNLIK